MHGNPARTKLGIFVRKRRELLGLSQGQLAKLAKVSQMTICRYESGDLDYIYEEWLKPLANALRCTESQLRNRAIIRPKQQLTSRTELGRIIRSCRIRKKMSRSELADAIGVERRSIVHLELGYHVYGNQDDKLVAIAEVLGLNPKVLFALRPNRKLKEVQTVNPFGHFLYEERVERHLTQEELGKLSGLSTATICCYETGRSLVTPKSLDLLLKALKCNVPARLAS